MSEEGEGGIRVDVFLLEGLVIHAEHEYTLYQGENLPDAAGTEGDDDGEDACHDFAEVEILYAQAAKEYSQQSCHATTLAAGA